MVEQLGETLNRFNISMCAYVLMPSHLHALLGFPDVSRLSEVVQSLKGLSSRRLKTILPNDVKNTFECHGRFIFWRRRFDDLIIWSENQFQIKAEYIHRNPARAGLVERPEDYVYSSAKDWHLNEPGMIHVDRNWQWQNQKDKKTW